MTPAETKIALVTGAANGIGAAIAEVTEAGIPANAGVLGSVDTPLTEVLHSAEFRGVNEALRQAVRDRRHRVVPAPTAQPT